jgi:hypothetical protein
MTTKRLRLLTRAVAALSAMVGLLVFALPALANAPNPGSTTVDSVVVNPDGSRTVTVQGTWTWQTQSGCAKARNGVGYQIDWFDNQANAVGSANDPDGVLYVGDAQDDIVHSDEAQPPSGSGYAPSGGPFAGVPTSYLSHNQSSVAPTQTDASNWFGDCSGTNSSGVTAGTWGPISHTYAASFTGQIQLCPIMYDPHGGSNNSGKSSVNDITAGANAQAKGYNTDNSYETNQTGPGPGICPKVPIPTVTTSASSAPAGSPIHDAATVSGSGGASATITWNVYAASDTSCKTSLKTLSESVSGDGTFDSPDYTPPGAGS